MKTNGSADRTVSFPPTPEHPATINAELQYRLDFLRVLDRTRREAVKAQQHLPATSAWTRADQWLYGWIIKAARESIEDLGPLSSNAQRAELADFALSLEENKMTLDDTSKLMAVGLSKPEPPPEAA
jgi:hypothetical protein